MVVLTAASLASPVGIWKVTPFDELGTLVWPGVTVMDWTNWSSRVSDGWKESGAAAFRRSVMA